MRVYIILSFASVLLLTTSCKSEIQKQKERQINKNISAMKMEMDSIQKPNDSIVAIQSSKPIEQPKNESKIDNIIGIWEVKNDYYMAVYEIERYKNQYIGKIHYYNDGKTEHKGKNNKNDYFLEKVSYEKGIYKGNIYMSDGKKSQVIFRLKNKDEIEAKMSIQGSPYVEIWKRQKTK